VILPVVRIKSVASVIAFLLLALVVMGVAALVGTALYKTFHHLGLGCLDRLAGAAFGLVQGVLLVTLIVLLTVAFFPETRWLEDARMPRMFFGACHLSTHVTPAELSGRIKRGLRILEKESPRWLHPDVRGL
jgi:membrane protein required for colicin V production